ncbi:hypothetical protein [Desulfobacca acetoxidans]|uniref:WGR domain-containing protein n=1 Tax=Desulfobacca acetoxidans (strain ATCC 700848 / DSM 11109 / ASRB2) TaxID=880072 RepID=F2NI54_DESAR|nr:hypothetical protein [Desulfobacca acetoxidans]AEB09823.1 hypothetical protein Desac_1992 [Desulfobacca acetoxidans DSM 11109]
MAPLSSDVQRDLKDEFHPLIIEDSWEGTIYLEAEVIKEWQGVCGGYKILRDPEGRMYWWGVFPAANGKGARQRLVSFLNRDEAAEALETLFTGRRGRLDHFQVLH